MEMSSRRRPDKALRLTWQVRPDCRSYSSPRPRFRSRSSPARIALLSSFSYFSNGAQVLRLPLAA